MTTPTHVSVDSPLGREISTYRYNLMAGEGMLVTLGVFVSPLLAIALLNVMSIQSQFGTDPLADRENWWCFALLLLWFAAGTRTVIHAVRRRLDRLILYEKGFQFRLRGTQGVRTFDEVEQIKHTAKGVRPLLMFMVGIRARDTFAITCRGKPDVFLDEALSDVLAAGRAVQKAVRARLTASALADIDARGELALGPFVVGRQGLRYGEEALSWSEIASIDVVRSTKGLSFASTVDIEDVFLFRRGTTEPWAIVAVSDVPNEFVLVELVERLRGTEPTGSHLAA